MSKSFSAISFWKIATHTAPRGFLHNLCASSY
jgi:hypothetical protein